MLIPHKVAKLAGLFGAGGLGDAIKAGYRVVSRVERST